MYTRKRKRGSPRSPWSSFFGFQKAYYLIAHAQSAGLFPLVAPGGMKRKEKRGKEGRRGEERREEGRRGEREEANRGLEGDRERNREGRRREEDLVCAFGCSVEAPREISGALWASWECFGSSLRAFGWPISRASRRRQPENNQKTKKTKKHKVKNKKTRKTIMVGPATVILGSSGADVEAPV